MRKPSRIEPGARVRTNARFLALFQPPATRPWVGVVVEPHEPVPGCWILRVDGLSRPQYVNEKYLEVES